VPSFALEKDCTGLVAGVDEVGRGCIAGVVVAAAVILHYLDPLPLWIYDLHDSKKVPPVRRVMLAQKLHDHALVGIGEASVEEIDTLNILQASHLAMMRAIKALPIQPNHVLIDGHLLPKMLTIPAMPVVKGDSLSYSIAAASIVAKVYRDALMVLLHEQYPVYQFNTHKGYPSLSHKKALSLYGATPWHRKSFAPVKFL
jgi:ribonuclease HII